MVLGAGAGERGGRGAEQRGGGGITCPSALLYAATRCPVLTQRMERALAAYCMLLRSERY
eukprot:3940513-Rhodomonas_salina.2